MKIIDFGKNTYQCEIDFKFDCISAETVRRIVENLHISKKHFSAISKDASTNQTMLTQGEGTPQSPYFGVRIGLDKILIWAGWHVAYEKWQQWRTSVLTDPQMLIQEIPIQMVLACTNQCVSIVPANTIKRGAEIPELGPVRAFYARSVPEELLERYNAFLSFGDKSGKEVLSFFVGPGQTLDEGNITFNFRWNTFDYNTTAEQNVIAHSARADKLLERFNSGLLSLLINEEGKTTGSILSDLANRYGREKS